MQFTNGSSTQVFVSYSHNDKRWLELLQIHLSPLMSAGDIELWDDTRIAAGKDWRGEIEQALRTAQVAVVLVSPYFLASKFIQQEELPALLEAAQHRGTRIMPLILSHCLFLNSPLGRFQAVNNPDRPLAMLDKARRDKVLNDFAKSFVEGFNDRVIKPPRKLNFVSQQRNTESPTNDKVNSISLLALTRDLATQVESCPEFNQEQARCFFYTKIARYYKLFNDVHDNYVNSLKAYKRTVRELDRIDVVSFRSLIEGINDDMVNSFNRRSSLTTLNILAKLNRENSSAINKHYANSRGFISAINQYLFDNKAGFFNTDIEIPDRPLEIPDGISDISEVDFNQIFPRDHAYNTSRAWLVAHLKLEFETYLRVADPEGRKEYVRTRMIEIMDRLLMQLNKKFLKVKIEYEELEDKMTM